MERLHILDGYGYIYRAHYGLAYGGTSRQGVRLTTQDGMPTGALYVYASMLIRLYLDVRPERIAVVFDAPGPTFRDEIDREYKATRHETPDDLKVQLPYFRELTEKLCWPVIAKEGVEADDVIATLVRRARERDWDVVIYSADKDLMQLVDDRVVVIDSMRDRTYDGAGVTEKFGVPPAQVKDWLALVGDTSDNIPGVAGVGAKTAARLLGEHGSIDAILARAGELKGKLKERFTDPEQLERLALSRRLVELHDTVEVGVELEDLVARPWDGEPLRQLFEKLEFQALLERLGAKTPSEAPVVAPSRVEIAPPQVAAGPEDLAPVLAAAREAGRLSLHLETDGRRPDRARVVGLALAAPGPAPLYVPLSHRYLSAPRQLQPQELGELREVIADPRVELVCHDAKAVIKALSTLEMDPGSALFDAMLAAYLIDASSEAYGLHDVLADAAGVELTSRKKLLGAGKKAVSFEAVAVEDAARYLGTAAGALLAAADVLERRIDGAELRKLLREVELPLAGMLARLEQTGITLDTAWLRQLSDRTGAQIAALERQVHELAGEPLNLGSPKQLSQLLFHKLGLTSERMKKTKTGFSTDHQVLDAMRDDHPIIAPILEHRELIKLKGTYIDALPPLVNPQTGRLHTDFRQAVAATGRLSSVDPNLQNIPIRRELGREIRRAFVAAEGKALVSADYSQIELRVLAHLCGDPVLTRAFVDDIDVHTQTAAEVFGIELEEVGEHERRVAKAVNYGLVYGQSDFGLSRALDIPRSEAKHYIDRYFERFSTVSRFMEELVRRARQAGVTYTVLGRRRPVPGLTSRNYRVRTAAERVAQNTPMQGSAADIMKLAMLGVDGMMKKSGFEASMLLTVHDELVFEVAEGQAEEFAAAVAREMEKAYELEVPLKVDVGIGKNWADAH